LALSAVDTPVRWAATAKLGAIANLDSTDINNSVASKAVSGDAMNSSINRGPKAIIQADGSRTIVAPVSVSVILSTYNSPQWLEKAVWGYATQTFTDFELVIADDGSTCETAQLVHRLRAETGLDMRHVWHDDLGFRKCTILNRALVAATGEYLVFSDGDCVPRRDFVETHVACAERNSFLSGGCVRLPLGISRQLTTDDVVNGRHFSPRWLLRQGVNPNLKLLKLMAKPALAIWLNRLTSTRPTWNGHNVSGWKSDLVAANGFDERMRYGGEDRELGERLVNAGVVPRQVRYTAICVHLEHRRDYVSESDLHRNREIRRETRRNRAVRTAYGIQPSSSEVATVRRRAS
jgi:glycosyltransferase involved in cell wall biosynthesis